MSESKLAASGIVAVSGFPRDGITATVRASSFATTVPHSALAESTGTALHPALEKTRITRSGSATSDESPLTSRRLSSRSKPVAGAVTESLTLYRPAQSAGSSRPTPLGWCANLCPSVGTRSTDASPQATRKAAATVAKKLPS